jgi:hypothetical protein
VEFRKQLFLFIQRRLLRGIAQVSWIRTRSADAAGNNRITTEFLTVQSPYALTLAKDRLKLYRINRHGLNNQITKPAYAWLWPVSSRHSSSTRQQPRDQSNTQQWLRRSSCSRSWRCPRARTSPSRTCPSGSSAGGAPPPRRRGRPSPSATSRSTSPSLPTPGSSTGPCFPAPSASTRYCFCPVLDSLAVGLILAGRSG